MDSWVLLCGIKQCAHFDIKRVKGGKQDAVLIPYTLIKKELPVFIYRLKVLKDCANARGSREGRDKQELTFPCNLNILVLTFCNIIPVMKT